MQGIASDVKQNQEKQQALDQQKQDALEKADQDVKNMSEFLEKSKERKIRLQKERQDVQKAILEQIQIKETKKKSLASLLTQKDTELEYLLKQFKTEDAKIVQQIGIMDETMKSISEFRGKSVDQTDMLSEDLASTNSLKQGLVFSREELEAFVAQLKSQVKDWSPEL